MKTIAKLIIYDEVTNTTSTREYDSHTECFADYTNLRSAGVEVRIEAS